MHVCTSWPSKGRLGLSLRRMTLNGSKSLNGIWVSSDVARSSKTSARRMELEFRSGCRTTSSSARKKTSIPNGKEQDATGSQGPLSVLSRACGVLGPRASTLGAMTAGKTDRGQRRRRSDGPSAPSLCHYRTSLPDRPPSVLTLTTYRVGRSHKAECLHNTVHFQSIYTDEKVSVRFRASLQPPI
jgi:hypothetical protein